MLGKLKKINKWLAGSFIIIFFSMQSLHVFEFEIFNKIEGLASDFRLKTTLSHGVDERIVIADINEDSLKEFGQWPWNRHTLAQLINTLFDHYQIKVLGFDMVFAESAGDDFIDVYNEINTKTNVSKKTKQALAKQANQDEIFAQSLKGKNVTSGIFFNQGKGSPLNTLPNAITQIDAATHLALILPKPKNYTANISLIQQASLGAGFFDNPIVDKDGVFRRVPLLQSYQGLLYPSLALSVAQQALNHAPLDIQLLEQGEYLAIESVQLGNRLIPTDAQGAVHVPFRGPEGSYPYISVKDILLTTTERNKLKNKIILLGTSAPGLLDLRATPVDESMPGVEVHANIIAGILDQSIAQEPAYLYGAMFLLSILLGLILLIAPHFLAPIFTLVLCGVLAAINVYGNFYLYAQGLIFPLASPLLMILSFFIFHMSWGFFIESKQKRAITRLFGQYVPPQLVDEMAKQPESIRLEGENKELSVLFADVRNFTTISERLSPTKLTHLMNQLLTPMTQAIYAQLGTVDKYMGDAIMAFWGAPLEEKQHAHKAIFAALDMQKKIIKLNSQLTNQGLSSIVIGIGINSGFMNVGNMGSEFRMAYTVMGDAVNLGSRLEGLSKVYGAKIVVSEFTKQAAPEFLYRPLDKVRVKGKSQPIAIYEPLDLKSQANIEDTKNAVLLEQAFVHYAQMQWSSALEVLQQLQAQNRIEYETIIGLYMQRIEHFQEQPPEEGWDGVYTFTNK